MNPLLHLGDTMDGAGGATVHEQRGLQGMAGYGEVEPKVGAATTLGSPLPSLCYTRGMEKERAATTARRSATTEVRPRRCPTRARWGERERETEGGEEKRPSRLTRAGTKREEPSLRRPVWGAVALPAAGSERPRENGESCVRVFFL